MMAEPMRTPVKKFKPVPTPIAKSRLDTSTHGPKRIVQQKPGK